MKPSINDYSLGDFENVDEYRNWKFEAIAKLELQLQQAQAELAGMELMEAEGETFGETIVRENEQLKEEIAAWEAKAALFADQGDQLQQAQAELEYIGELTGIAGVDKPLTITECVQIALEQSLQREALLIEKLDGVIQDMRYSIGPHDDNPTLEQALIMGWTKRLQALKEE